MSALPNPVTPAVLQFDARGLPVSEIYGDIYRPPLAPFDQARHVFLAGNGLPQRWAGRSQFTVCETGFGLGHNFLALWQAWRNDAQRSARLHVVSFEAHPFLADDLQRYYRQYLPQPELGLGLQLVQRWPPPVSGVHRLQFDHGAVTLTLFFGEAGHMLRQLDARVDAFFLDGFAPKRNPEMWSRAVFGQLVRVADPAATLATWSSAGEVRRALQDEGFLPRKVRGVGGKSQITVATLRPELHRAVAVSAKPDHVVVVGAGIAGASTARALAERGCSVQVLDPALAAGPSGGHAGHAGAAVSPMFNRTDDARARLSRAAVMRAWQNWQSLEGSARPLVCGTFYPALSDEDARLRQTTVQEQGLSSLWVRWLQPAHARELVGGSWQYGGVWFPYGQRVQPPALVAALLDHPNIRCVSQRVAGLRSLSAGGWQVFDDQGATLAQAQAVVLCNAANAWGLAGMVRSALPYPRLQALSSVAGEIYFIDTQTWPGPRAIVAGHGYALPAQGANVVVGSTYRRGVCESVLSLQGRSQVLDKMQVLLGGALAQGSMSGTVQSGDGWAGWRASVSDRFPVVGPLEDSGVWINACHASRGFSWAGLAADVLAARMFGEPVPLERELCMKMMPR